jgi:DNA-binding NarL/FixJ family response regulator
MTEIRVLIVDDHAILRHGLQAMLGYQSDIRVVGEAQNGNDALTQLADLRPDVILMDIAMQGMNGLEATRIIRERYPRIRVLILSQHEDRQYVVPLLQAGASGYVLKRALGTDLISAIRAVFNGEIYLDPGINMVLVDEIRLRNPDKLVPAESLTVREREILHYIVQGLTNSQIAVKLSLSTKTVEWHRANLMSKLDTHNVADLVRFALMHGLGGDELKEDLS